MGAMEEAVEDGLRQGGVGHRGVPVVDGHLAGDQSRAQLRTVLHHFEQVTALLDRGRGEEEIVEDQELGTPERREEPHLASVGASESEVVEQSWGAGVEGGVVLADG